MKSTILTDQKLIPEFDWKIHEIMEGLKITNYETLYTAISIAVLDEKNEIYRVIETKGPDEFMALTERMEEIGFKRVRKTRRTKMYDSIYRFHPEGYHETRD